MNASIAGERAACIAVGKMLAGIEFDDTIPPAMWAQLSDPAYVAFLIAEEEAIERGDYDPYGFAR